MPAAPFETLPVLLALVGGYLCGTIAFGLILTRIFGLGDLRAIGSGNIGATNVLRTGNKLVAALTLLGDVLKASVPIWMGPAETDAFVRAEFEKWGPVVRAAGVKPE